jgi:ubiquinone/menaquinone biosynthesis C-methylase UbiE
MTDPLPYEDAFFEAIISTQVIHHGRLATIKAVVAEIERVLKPGGLVFITVPAAKNQAKTFEEIEPHTFIPLDGPEKGLPHYYFTPETLRLVFENFEILDIHVDQVAHYCLAGIKVRSG